MKRMSAAAVLMGLAVMNAAPVVAQSASRLDDEAGGQIVVVNRSVTPVHVFMEDSDGRRLRLGGVDSGEAKTLRVPADALDQGDFRVRVLPRGYVQSRRDPVSIRTPDLHVQDDETVVLWLDRELARSKVEVIAG